MSRASRSFTMVLVLSAGVALVASACSDDVETHPVPTTTPTGSGAGGSTTTTGGTGGVVGGGGSGGEIPLTGEDLCPGDPYSLTAPTFLALQGDTSLANADYEPWCESDSGRDLVYQFDVEERGSLAITLLSQAPSQLDPALYLRREFAGGAGGNSGDVCGDDDYTWACSSFSGSQEVLRFHTEPDTIYVHVDGASQTEGAYTLEVDFDHPECGDCVVNPAEQGSGGGGGAGGATPGEQCDDCNNDPNDGCDQCTFVLNDNFDICPGELINLNVGGYVYTGSTLPYQGDYEYVAQQPGCALSGMPAGRDRLYHVVPAADGTVRASVGWDVTKLLDVCVMDPNDPGCWDRALYAYGPGPSSCGDAQAQIACSDDKGAGWEWSAIEEIEFPVTANQDYYIVIDSIWSDPNFPQDYAGLYNLHIELIPN